MQMLEKDEIIFDFFFLLNGGDYIKNRKRFKEFSKDISNFVSGKPRYYPVPLKQNPLGIEIATLILFFKILFKYRNKEVVIHARGLFCAYIASLLKKTISRVSYVFDVRGDYLAEYKFESYF